VGPTADDGCREPAIARGKGRLVEATDDDDDAALIQASLTDPAAFAGVYDRHARSLAAYLIRRVGPAEAESLLGELFRVAFESRDRYQLDRADARPWLYGIAAHLVMKHFRSQGRGRRAWELLAARRDAALPLDEQVASAVTATATWSRVAAAIDELPDRDREVLLLYAWEELSYVEIAEALDIPVGTVRSRLNRVRRVLRELVADEGEGPDVPTQRARKGAVR
jgi:RNA polymerase sigma factor (sigma-70 family)